MACLIDRIKIDHSLCSQRQLTVTRTHTLFHDVTVKNVAVVFVVPVIRSTSVLPLAVASQAHNDVAGWVLSSKVVPTDVTWTDCVWGQVVGQLTAMTSWYLSNIAHSQTILELLYRVSTPAHFSSTTTTSQSTRDFKRSTELEGHCWRHALQVSNNCVANRTDLLFSLQLRAIQLVCDSLLQFVALLLNLNGIH